MYDSSQKEVSFYGPAYRHCWGKKSCLRFNHVPWELVISKQNWKRAWSWRWSPRTVFFFLSFFFCKSLINSILYLHTHPSFKVLFKNISHRLPKNLLFPSLKINRFGEVMTVVGRRRSARKQHLNLGFPLPIPWLSLPPQTLCFLLCWDQWSVSISIY